MDFASTVNEGNRGLYGIQLTRDGQTFDIGALAVSTGQDVRIFSSGGGLGVNFKEAFVVLASGSLTVQGSFSNIGVFNGLTIGGAL